MKKKRVSFKGTAMLWAVLVMLMISLISAGIIFISRVYYVREQEESNRYQAKLYAESAIELISADIEKHKEPTDPSDPSTGYLSKFVSAVNSTETVTVVFPDAENWKCTVTISHSVVNIPNDPNLTEAQKNATARTSGEIYLTAKVTRHTPGGNALELAEVCAKMTNPTETETWTPAVYYTL